ncbi:MAG: hypothetical protein LBL04_00405 [Bacteroidales bacterium]|nr:hypothetical protein [Bacteroidales bacterium]
MGYQKDRNIGRPVRVNRDKRGQHRPDACRRCQGRDAMHRVSTSQPDRLALRTGVGAAPDLTGSADLSGSTETKRTSP